MAKRFRDVVQNDIRLKGGNKVVLFVPHTSEYIAVTPLLSKLSEALKKDGKEIEKEINDGMRQWIHRITNQLSMLKLSKEDRIFIERLFKLKDGWIRLQKLSELIERNPTAIILEIHALDGNYGEENRFWMADYFYRLPNTRVLVIRDYVSEYKFPIEKGFSQIDWDNKRHLDILECFELKMDEIRTKYIGLLDVLSKNIDRSAMIEIPAPIESGIPRSGVWFLDRLILKLYSFPPHFTKFEENYGWRLSREATITEEDIRGILRMVLESEQRNKV